jgi:dihydropyrimidinase
MQLDLVIRGGTVVTAGDSVVCDVGIRDGRVAALADRLPGAREEIDATGKLVMPGGVDAHCHIDEPAYRGVKVADDFASGTIAAACGGTTTILSFACQAKGETLRSVVEAHHKKAEGKAVIDYGFHLIVTDPHPGLLGQELPALIEDGYCSLKIFMTYDGYMLEDRQILETLDAARRHNALVMVHAENGHCIHWLSHGLTSEGRHGLENFTKAAPMAVEREATHRAIALAEIVGTEILIVHVSGREAVEQIRWAQARGHKVLAETCPQYLFTTENDIARPGWEGAKFACSPPPRDADNVPVLWRGLADGTFQVFSSDHCPYRADGPGKSHPTEAPRFDHIAVGVPGIETRLPLLFSAGCGGGRLTPQQFVALTATNPARIYGLYPRKGTIAVGGDADIAIWDPDRDVEIRHERLHDAAGYTPYEGMRVRGWPIQTLSRGVSLWRDGRVTAERGRGQFLRRRRPA